MYIAGITINLSRVGCGSLVNLDSTRVESNIHFWPIADPYLMGGSVPILVLLLVRNYSLSRSACSLLAAFGNVDTLRATAFDRCAYAE